MSMEHAFGFEVHRGTGLNGAGAGEETLRVVRWGRDTFLRRAYDGDIFVDDSSVWHGGSEARRYSRDMEKTVLESGWSLSFSGEISDVGGRTEAAVAHDRFERAWRGVIYDSFGGEGDDVWIVIAGLEKRRKSCVAAGVIRGLIDSGVSAYDHEEDLALAVVPRAAGRLLIGRDGSCVWDDSWIIGESSREASREYATVALQLLVAHDFLEEAYSGNGWARVGREALLATRALQRAADV